MVGINSHMGVTQQVNTAGGVCVFFNSAVNNGTYVLNNHMSVGVWGGGGGVI